MKIDDGERSDPIGSDRAASRVQYGTEKKIEERGWICLRCLALGSRVVLRKSRNHTCLDGFRGLHPRNF